MQLKCLVLQVASIHLLNLGTASAEFLHLISLYCILAFSKQKNQKAGERSIKKEKKILRAVWLAEFRAVLNASRCFLFSCFSS